ncbi:MAG: hypothetical protein AB7F89_18585 [Pirellulaceae bacterium]
MRLTLLIQLAAALPLAWGYAMFWLVTAWWPRRDWPRETRTSDQAPQDYQI